MRLKASFRQRQYIILLLVVIVPLLIVNGLLLPGSRNFIISQSTAQLESVADLKTVGVDEWLHQGRRVAQMISRNSTIRSELPLLLDSKTDNINEGTCACSEKLRTELQGIVTIFPAVAVADLLDPVNGRVILSTELTREQRIRANEDYFREGRKALFVSPVTYSVGQEAPIQVVSTPIFDESGELLAVVAVELDFNNLRETIDNRAGLGETGRAYLVDAYGFFVTLPQQMTGNPLRTIARSDGVKRVISGQNGSGLYVDHNGVDVLGVYRRLSDANLGLLVEIDQAELTQTIWAVWLAIGATALGILLLGLIAVRYLTTWLVQPLELISEAARALKAGDLNQRTLPSHLDEIGQLSTAFNEMADALQQSHEHLEEQVKQRTAELQTAMSELSESEERFRRLSQLAKEGVVIHERGKILDFNLGLMTMFGYTPEMLKTINIVDLAAEEFSEIMTMNMYSSQEHIYEVMGRRQDGSQFPAEIHSRSFPYKGHQARVATIRDLTERKQAEQRKIDLTMERERVNILTRFVTGASHEFRTPLSVINTKAYLMQRINNADQRAEHLKAIGLQINNLTHLIDDLVLLTRLESEPDMQTEMINVNRMLDEIATENGMGRVTLEHTPKLGGIRGDQELLHKALTEIVDNAIHFTPEPGQICIQTFNEEDRIRIEITDYGVGMSKEVLARIFERFYRADDAHSTRGFGLGLPIAQKIITLHQGEITVSSTPGAGTKVTIVLPTIARPSADNNR